MSTPPPRSGDHTLSKLLFLYLLQPVQPVGLYFLKNAY